MTTTTAPPLDARLQQLFGRYVGGPDRLNLGCARNPLHGFTNLDLDPRVAPDVRHDLEQTPLPFPDAAFDCILGSHVFEHVHRFLPLVADLYRILKPGGYLIAVTPHCGSDDAWDSPHHVRAFSERTWHYVSTELYDRPGHAGAGAYQGAQYGAWQIVEVRLVPYADVVEDLQRARLMGQQAVTLDVKKRFFRNVVQEVHAVLQKPEAHA